MSESRLSRGLPGAVLKLLGAGDHTLTVTERQQLTPHYLRLTFTAGDLLTAHALHPTMWIRMWFADGDKLHQRGYTLVDPDPQAGTVAIEFALHDGVAANWARNAKPGDSVDVTVLGSNFALPQPRPAGYIIVGDTASLPAVNSLLDAIEDTPSWVFLEAAHEDDKQLPVRGRATDVEWVDRKNNGEALIQAISSSVFDASDHFGWVACDNRTTRAVAKVLREDYRMPRKSIKAQAYWVA
ncbi:NADPH-dependent ferric siderophore reductase [Mycolicibacterium moriokaense]|uniref:Siderophore-interacting protein n=1 Tax=Mycolicibacterium moriokaense TaxID=39691 RepID=A0AAD1H9K7_9MYCO|nr:siderophore-interacting protein [Mycolicibacterium moriokaense]MCV7042648.1 siderophore-interacting protein [Mycolicibacterium moriokaense]ORB23440.1 NADPH-dependent ferric siderophore reductase [Mycolicibacterium moriokaense]BBX01197.1 putative siderophore-interacting protein [Mycolicibacterium moriokaense]